MFFLYLMSLSVGCNIGPPPPPTPGPFPLEGVRQMTSDYAFYKDLLWAPNGTYIAATRCPVMKYQPVCYEHEKTILIDPQKDTIIPINFETISPNHTIGYPRVWSPDGMRLILNVGKRNSAEDIGANESLYQYNYYSYAIDERIFTEIEIIWRVIAFSQDGSKLLITQGIDEETLALGWHVTETSEFIEELSYPLSNNFLGPYTFSPDNQILLQSDSSITSSCNEVQAYTMGSHEPFEPFLSLACYPAWSQDGSKLAYTSKASTGDLPNRLIISNKDGSDPVSLFPQTTPHELAYPTWSPDGRYIAFTFGAVSGANAIYIVDVPEPLQPSSE